MWTMLAGTTNEEGLECLTDEGGGAHSGSGTTAMSETFETTVNRTSLVSAQVGKVFR